MSSHFKFPEYDKSEVFFIGDTHFYHEKCIDYDSRPFKDAEHMNEELIKRWNAKVPVDAHVFVLGDFVFGGVGKINSIIDRLNGNIHLIAGNHDLLNWKACLSVDFYDLKMQETIVVDGITLVLNHYPFENWGGEECGVVHLHAHMHSSEVRPYTLKRNRYDVGVTNNNFEPVTIDEICINIARQNQIIDRIDGTI